MRAPYAGDNGLLRALPHDVEYALFRVLEKELLMQREVQAAKMDLKLSGYSPYTCFDIASSKRGYISKRRL